jgi:hypothetical protein
MNADETLFNYAVENARQQKEEIVARSGVGSDLQPMLALHRDTELLGMVHLPGDPEAALSAVTVAVAHSEANIVVHMGEGFWWIGGSSFDYLIHEAFGQRGDLARRFAAGDEAVVECLQVAVFSVDHAMFHAAPYRYAGRTVVWQPEAISFDDGGQEKRIDGNMYASVHEGFALRATTPAASSPQEFGRLTGLSPVAPLGPRPERNAPCPCGSGRKSKACCWR